MKKLYAFLLLTGLLSWGAVAFAASQPTPPPDPDPWSNVPDFGGPIDPVPPPVDPPSHW
jgi:hypothetical protein